MKKNESSSLFLEIKMKEELKVKVKKKAIDEEGGENQKKTMYK